MLQFMQKQLLNGNVYRRVAMITKEQCLAAMHSQYVYHLPSGRKWRVSGRCKVWVRTPESFRLPIKWGLYNSGTITETNCSEFSWSPKGANNGT